MNTTKKINPVVSILMERDDITKEEAEEQIAECREAMMDAISCGYFTEAEECIEDYLGLEPDYLYYII